MPSGAGTKPAAIAVFAKLPIPGQVKTRLQERLGIEGCLRLHEALLLDSVDRIATMGMSTYLYLSSPGSDQLHKFCQGANLPEGIQPRIQRGRNLGERMLAAFQQLLPTYRCALVVGADSPSVPLEYLEAGIDSLRHIPVAVGPASDGGYYAIGLNRPRESLFQGIDWGGDDVFRQTMARLRPDEVAVLPEWYDIDRIDDVRRLSSELRDLPSDQLRRLRAVLADLEDLLPAEQL